MADKQKILIVDDDSMNIKILSIILENDYELQTAKDGEEALAILEDFQANIVLLDVMMPGIDGFEVCQRIRAQSWAQYTKVLLITAKTELNDRLTGYEVGADDYITKPFEEEELVAKVKVFTRLNEEEKKLQQTNRRLLLRQQDIPNMLWDCDKELRFTYIDESSATILGYPADDMLGKHISEFIAGKDKGEFFVKFIQDTDRLTQHVRGITFSFLRSDGEVVPMQIFADEVVDQKGKSMGMVGIFRDVRPISRLYEKSEESRGQMAIQLDKNCHIVEMGDKARELCGMMEGDDNLDFSSLLIDPALSSMFPFAFDQQEDIPFPVEIKIMNTEGIDRYYSVTFTYLTEKNVLEGILSPVAADDQLGHAAEQMDHQKQKINSQQETLDSAVIVDEEMQESIVLDVSNLSAEILEIIKILQPFAFTETGTFDPEEYKNHIFNRNIFVYQENLRLLGNKIHGLKGSCGFLMQSAKQLCHRMEDITRPLAEQKLVLTQSLSLLLKQFVFQIEDMLDKFTADSKCQIPVEDWLKKIDQSYKKASEFIGGHADAFNQLMNERTIDNGAVRQRKKEEYLSVSLTGYEVLAEQVQELFYNLSSTLSQEELIQASHLYNQFLSTHQQIKKVPINLSRYERLIPNIAKDYGKEADFVFIDHQVKADIEFWNLIHEILNHVLKNAVIHGIELPEERKSNGKETAGKVTVELGENALNILLTVSDDGKGINVEKLRDKALSEKIISMERAESISDQEVLELLFLQGVSTADSLDDNAGRGVGMNAVLEAVQQLRGNCDIINLPGEGCRYEFSFQKSNVSLPCVIVTIGDLNLAIPEDYVESFVDYIDQNVITIKQKPAYKYNGSLVPLVDSNASFDREAETSGHSSRSVVILNHRDERRGLVINGILHHANLPIIPTPKLYREVQIYQGITIFNNDPIQVINVEKLNC